MSRFAVGDEVWVFHRGWRKGQITRLAPNNDHRVNAQTTVNGRTIERWFGGAHDGGWPVYPGDASEPTSYTCTDPRCPMRVPWEGHPGVTVEQLKQAHENSWHNKDED